MPLTAWPAVSLGTDIGAGQSATPEPASAHSNETTIALLFQPWPFAAGTAEAVIVGPVLSRATVRLTVPAFPAMSAAVPVTVWVPSAVSVTGGEQVARPDSASAHSKVTVTLLLFQPSTGVGDTLAVIVGGVRSSLIVVLAVAELPALSRAVPETTMPALSAVTIRAAGHSATPLPVSRQSKLTVTSPRCQPASFGSGDAFACAAGGIVSTRNPADALPSFPARSCTVALIVCIPSAKAKAAGSSATASAGPTPKSSVRSTPSSRMASVARSRPEDGSEPGTSV